MINKIKDYMKLLNKIVDLLGSIEKLEKDIDEVFASVEGLERQMRESVLGVEKELGALKHEFEMALQLSKADILEKTRKDQRASDARLQDALVQISEGTGKLKMITDNPTLYIGNKGGNG